MQRLRLMSTACLAIVLMSTIVGAQSRDAAESKPAEPASTTTEAAKIPADAAPPTEKPAGAARYLPDANGKLVEILDGASYEGYLEYVRSQQGEPFHISEVRLVGTADDVRANLTATLKIVVHRDNEWVTVPLGLNEGVLKDVKHEGVGRYKPVTPFSRETGHRWRLFGKGEHTLILPMIVPISKTIATRRMVLTIPPAAVSEMKLTVPVALDRLLIKSPKNIQPRRASAGNDSTEIELYGLGSALDLQWEAVPESARIEPILKSETTITVGPSGESLVVEASQKISAIQGTFSEVTVSLPAGFTLLKVTAGKEHREHKMLADNRVTVQLAEATGGPIELNWLLETDFPLESDRLTLQGFTIENTGVREQEGTIAIKPFDGFHVSRSERPQDNRNVRRIDVSKVAPSGKFMSAYSFFQQPFRLMLTLTELQPSYGVEPKLLLRMSRDSAELKATFRFDVPTDGGTVKRIDLTWPNQAKQNWELDAVRVDGVEGTFASPDENNSDVLRIPLDRARTGSFDVTVRAHRRIPSNGESFELTLPRVEAPRVSPTVLLVSGDENVVFNVDAVAPTTVERVSKDVLATLPLPEGVGEFSRANYQDFLVTSGEQVFQAVVTVHPQRIQSETAATVELNEGRLLVTQRITFDVSFEQLRQLQLTVPADITDVIEFYLNEDRASDENVSANRGVRLAPTWSGNEEKKPRVARIELPDPRIGKFDIVARYVIELPEGFSPEQPVHVALPLVEAGGEGFNASQLRFRNFEQIGVTVEDNAWKRRASIDDVPTWSGANVAGAIPLLFSYTASELPGRYTISRSLIRTTIEHGGTSRSVGQYWIDGAVKFLYVTMPIEIAPERFWWNQTRLADSAVKIPDGSGRYRIDLSGLEDSPENLLTIEFHAKNPTPLSWYRDCRLEAPLFPSNVWVAETIWELTLPSDQHLFLPPQDMTSRFRWVRNTVFWSRQPEPDYADLARRISSASGPELRLPADNGNSYVFSHIGAVPQIEFESMSRPAIVLFGAGLTLAVGFVLLKVPRLRNVLTLLALAFVLALAGMWYEAPIKLLLQPAALGLILAVAAVWIDGLTQSRKSSTLVPMSSPSDFVLPSASSFAEQPAGIGSHSDAVTTTRHTPFAPQEPVPSSESSHAP